MTTDSYQDIPYNMPEVSNYAFIRESSLIFNRLLHKHAVNKGDYSIPHLLTKVNDLQYKTCSENADRLFVLKVKSPDDAVYNRNICSLHCSSIFMKRQVIMFQ